MSLGGSPSIPPPVIPPPVVTKAPVAPPPAQATATGAVTPEEATGEVLSLSKARQEFRTKKGLKGPEGDSGGLKL